jgi:hypothetical protein
MSAITGKNSSSPEIRRETQANTPKPGVFSRIAQFLHIKPKGPSSPPETLPPVRSRSLSRIPSDSNIRIREQQETSSPIPMAAREVKPPRERRLSLNLVSQKALFTQKDRLDTERSQTVSTSSLTSSRLPSPITNLEVSDRSAPHSPVRLKYVEQLAQIHQLLKENCAGTTLAKRTRKDFILIRDKEGEYKWIHGAKEDKSEPRKDALESILMLLYLAFSDGTYQFYIHEEKNPIPNLEIASLLFDNTGTRDLIYNDKKRGLLSLWLKVLFLDKYHTLTKNVTDRLKLLRETESERKIVYAAVTEYQKALVEGFQGQELSVRMIEDLDLNYVLLKTDIESAYRAVKRIQQAPNSLLGHLSQAWISLDAYLEDCQILYENTEDLLTEMQAVDPKNEHAFLAYFLSGCEAQGRLKSKKWLTKDLLIQIAKAQAFFNERAYGRCLDAITQSLEKDVAERDHEFYSALLQFAQKGVFVLQKKKGTPPELLAQLQKIAEDAKRMPHLIAILFKEIARELKMIHNSPP